jgi:hypothetical protein
MTSRRSYSGASSTNRDGKDAVDPPGVVERRARWDGQNRDADAAIRELTTPQRINDAPDRDHTVTYGPSERVPYGPGFGDRELVAKARRRHKRGR